VTTTPTTISKTVFFNAPRETVWAFLTRKEKLAQWFHPSDTDLAKGSDYRLYRLADNGAKIPQIWGRVLTMEAPELLVYTFMIEPLGSAETTVTWLLEEAAGGTRLSLTHEGIAEAAGAAALGLLQALDHGWDEHLDRLRKAAG